ncbi:hypothetical protein B484DRAFT_435112 [Ochromonadaceae sp. CCMP2298]|nr:hypothetical protein B484DRAFT_435112 [Ochromonadaceae sp. CCMP2298]
MQVSPSPLDDQVGAELTGVLTRWGSQFGFITVGAVDISIHNSDWRDPDPPQTHMKVLFTLAKNGKGYQALNCVSAEEEDALANASATRPPNEHEIEQALVTHRRTLQRESCFICLDSACKPSVSMLCCGQPTHITCMQRWYATLHSGDGEMPCPYCRQGNAEPVPVPSEGASLVSRRRTYEANWNQPPAPLGAPPAPPGVRNGRNGVSPLIAELHAALAGRHRASRAELLQRPLRSTAASAIAAHFESIESRTVITTIATTITATTASNRTSLMEQLREAPQLRAVRSASNPEQQSQEGFEGYNSY